MINHRMLAGSLAAILGVLLVGLGASWHATTATAETPPNPPARFVGTVKVDGAAVPAGTTIEAKVGSASCGATTTFNSGGNARYTLDVPALDPGASPNCGTDGAAVTFYIGGKKAAETGSWYNYQLNTVNLTYTTPPTPTATVPVTPSVTPKPPSTGSGQEQGGVAAIWLFMALGLGALGFGLGGVAAARRSR